jgi:hypothetical protein
LNNIKKHEANINAILAFLKKNWFFMGSQNKNP